MTRPQRALYIKFELLIKTNMAEIQSAKNWKAVFKQVTGTIQLIVLYVKNGIYRGYFQGWTKLCKCLWDKISRRHDLSSWQSAMSKFQ
jgi:hypothetical protein